MRKVEFANQGNWSIDGMHCIHILYQHTGAHFVGVGGIFFVGIRRFTTKLKAAAAKQSIPPCPIYIYIYIKAGGRSGKNRDERAHETGDLTEFVDASRRVSGVIPREWCWGTRITKDCIGNNNDKHK